jgi:hypothetical protein
MTFCWFDVYVYRLLKQNLQSENLRIQTPKFSPTAFLHSRPTKHLNSNHQLFPIASFSEKLFRKKPNQTGPKSRSKERSVSLPKQQKVVPKGAQRKFSAQKSFQRECRAYSEKKTRIQPKYKAKREKSTRIPPK